MNKIKILEFLWIQTEKDLKLEISKGEVTVVILDHHKIFRI